MPPLLDKKNILCYNKREKEREGFMNTIEKNICQAIDIIVNKAMAGAKYDKTIQATVVSCVDATIGKYKVKYQDSTFYAYSSSSEVTYLKGANVYVLIPGNDMSNDKTILGATKKLGINYASSAVGDEQYEVNGSNLITTNGDFGLSSYRKGINGTYSKVLYAYNNEEPNLINIDQAAVDHYIKESSSLICGAVFRTDLPVEQRYRGNYGIIFALDFKNNGTEEIVTRTYVVDVNKMIGNPYKLVSATRQYGIFDIDKDNFVRINYIAVFTKDFPHTLPDDQCKDDIFIKDIEISGANRLTNEELNGYSLNFLTVRGTYFTSQDEDTRELSIEAQVKIKGRVTDPSSQQFEYYWFIEHAGITTRSVYYNVYGGQGWKCLNDYNIIDADESGSPVTVEWVPGSYVYTVQKKDVPAKNTTYKCVVVFNDTVIDKEIIITNLDSSYEITIVSDSGEQFYFDNGRPTLTCLVNDAEVADYQYSWSVTNNVGTFESLIETSDLNTDYNQLVTEYNKLLADINAETVARTPNETRLKELESSIAAYDNIQRVEKNKIHHLAIAAITNFSVYLCTVYSGDTYLGTSSIVIKNTYDVEGMYSLVIKNGTQVYKYDESGNAPNHSSKTNPIKIPALSIVLRDNNGEEISDEILSHCDINWIVPIENTMLQIPDDIEPISVEEEEGYAIYSGISLPYEIRTRYNINYQNNDIELRINYKGILLSTKTDITFTKEGEPGTNGTEFSCRIIPNVRSGVEPPAYPMAITSRVGTVSWNFTPEEANKYFKVQLWHNDQLIFNAIQSGDSTEGKNVSVTWNMLSNKYYDVNKDESSFTVDATTGEIGGGTYHNQYADDVRKAPVNILCATIVYDGITYYATLPIITAKISNDSYRIRLKDGTGFSYALYTSDGRSPLYDNSNPFELIIEQNLGSDQWEDVSVKTTTTYAVSYTWRYIGSVYADGGWKASINLADRHTASATAANQKWVKPIDTYNGQCLSNAVECIVSHATGEVCRIHIPVHLLLNQYGHAALNGWNGNSIQLSESGGFILAPQVGAGKKESDNSFTGMLMGEVKEGANSKSNIGLLGYFKGARVIFLDSETGKAEFGMNGKGKIVIDPTNDTAQIYSGNYSALAKTGLLIDLTTPEIRYGSGNFVVDSNGILTAAGANITGTINAANGSIAGWTIYNGIAYTGGQNNNSTGIGSYGSNLAFWAGNGKFLVKQDGSLVATSATITGSITATSGKIGGWTITSNLLYNGIGFTNAKDNNATGIDTDLGTWAFWAGNGRFSVTQAGVLYANSATITGAITATSGTFNNVSFVSGSMANFTVSGGYLYNGISIGSAQSCGISAGASRGGNNDYIFWAGNGVFRVNINGEAWLTNAHLTGSISASSGTIGPWAITSNAIYNSIPYTGTGNSNSTGIGPYGGNWAFWAGNGRFSVTQEGALYANNATIVGAITATSISAYSEYRFYSNGVTYPILKMGFSWNGVVNRKLYSFGILGDGSDPGPYISFLEGANITTNGSVQINGSLTTTGSVIIGTMPIYDVIMSSTVVGAGLKYWKCTGENGNLVPFQLDTNGAQAYITTLNIGNNNSYVNTIHYGGSLQKESDRRSKNDLGDLSITESLTLLRGTSIKKFTYKDDKDHILQYGIYAQDLRDLLISSGIGHMGALSIGLKDTDGEITKDLTYNEDLVKYSVDYVQFVSPIIVGWQYHDKEIEELKDEIKLLKQQLNDIRRLKG